MAKMTLDDIDLKDKRVLIRVDFNVPQDAEGNITNDRRIRSAMPTIKKVLAFGGSAIVMSHFGRPSGDPAKDTIYRMDKIGEKLSELMGLPVKKMDEVVGDQVKAAASELKPGQILLLENLRFHPGEKKGDSAFAKQLADLADVYVNDAFGTCHRKDASMVAVPEAMKGKPRVVGMLVAKELDILDNLLSSPPTPVVGIMGGAKVSDKIGFIKAMLTRVDKLLVGGAMTYTFMKAQGKGIGKSKCENDAVDIARELLELGQDKIVLPVDHLVADRPDKDAKTMVVDGDIPDDWFAMDIGPMTMEMYRTEIAKAGTVVWNGPLGKFEDAPFERGTRAIADALANSSGVTIVGGGETAEAVEHFGLDMRMKHVSTGGGAFLEYVEGTPFAALAQIDDKSS